MSSLLVKSFLAVYELSSICSLPVFCKILMSQEAKDVAHLQKNIKPYLLRRMKEDVEKAVPPKEETIIEVELTEVQKQYYRAIYEQNTTFLLQGKKRPQDGPSLMNLSMQLRKCCNHPYLIECVPGRTG